MVRSHKAQRPRRDLEGAHRKRVKHETWLRFVTGPENPREREEPEEPETPRPKVKLDRSGRPFTVRERGGKRAKAQRERIETTIRGERAPQVFWSETKIAAWSRRQELDALERQARAAFYEAGGVEIEIPAFSES